MRNAMTWVVSMAAAAAACNHGPTEGAQDSRAGLASGLAAFPGASGGGAASAGGRGGAVCEVTNTDDSGTGSLRDCLTRSGPRTVVFRVAGTIQLHSGIRITQPFVTVAGQTAPGGGIEISGKNDNEDGILIYTHDVTMRYLRVRMGSNPSRPPGSQTGSPIFIGNGDNHDIVVDHCSFSWTSDENTTIWSNSGINRKITFSWMINSEGLAGHSTGLITGTNAGSADQTVDIDVHHSYFVNNSHRQPLAKHKSMRWVNNIVYNWAFYASQALGGISADFIGNVYKRGPLDPGPSTHEIQLTEVDSGDGPKGTPSVYLSGNRGPHNASPGGDNWVMVARITGENGSETGAAPASFRRGAPMPPQQFPIAADDANALESVVLPSVGASQRLDCNGDWVDMRDAVDARLVDDYKNDTGSMPKSETDVGGFPTVAPGTACADADHDGMPDAWESAHGLNPHDASDGPHDSGDGYTNLEKYLNGGAVSPGPAPDAGPPPSPPDAGDCTSKAFGGATVSSASAAPGGVYTVTCDYGAVTNAIDLATEGAACTWTGWSGTAAQFRCTAKSTPGLFAHECFLSNVAPDHFCARGDAAPSIAIGAAPSCTNAAFVKGTLAPVNVAPGGTYAVTCDYGAITNAIDVAAPAGACAWTAWSGTAARFSCTAGATPGSFAHGCFLSDVAPNALCARADPLPTLTAQ